MRDRHVRAALHSYLSDLHSAELDDTLFVDEMGLAGLVRVDVAVVNGTLSGFELKSASDTLRRLPTQVEVYSQVLDHSTLVVAENHHEHACSMLPEWWGCLVATWDGETVALEEVRPAARNPSIDPYALATLLWRDEALAILDRHDAASGVRSKPRPAMWQRLVERLELPTLRDEVRAALKAREGWLVAR
ncbi:sce7726 family protein [Actinotalea caeni]|uniref:sce7726 family protein n=1 Tax=Actinotalea caeni TaxID=1348467 RepID=UPI0012E3050F|nr:sce7726 family protein [Actinotalea caeni]